MKDSLVDAKRATLTKKIAITKVRKCMIFTIFILISLISSLDQGILPIAITDIKYGFDFTDINYGLFTSLFYLGKLFGLLIFFFMIKHFSRKYILTFSLIIIALCSYVMTKFNHFWLLCLSRFFFGFFQIYFMTYMPLWCEQFTIQSTRMTMITLIQLSVPLGVIIGCISAAFFSWKNSFYVEIICNCIIGIILMFFNEKYFSLNVLSAFGLRASSIRSQGSVNNIFNSKNSVPSITRKSDDNEEENNDSPLEVLMKAGHNKVLLCSLFARAFLMLPMTIFYTWLNDYELNILQFDYKERILSFCLVCAVSPTIGTIIGGIIGGMIGGYEKKICVIIAFVLYSMSCFSGYLIIHLTSFWLFTSNLCICLSFSACIIPLLTGVIISSVPISIRNTTGSVSILMSNMFGHMPGPYLYGFLNVYGIHHNSPTLAMEIVTYLMALPFLFLLMTLIFKFKENPNESPSQSIFNKGTSNNNQSFKIKKSNLFTTSIAGIYGNHLEIEEDQDFYDKEYSLNSDNINSRKNSSNEPIKLGNSDPIFGSSSSLHKGSCDESNKTYISHYTADIKE